MIWQSLSKQKVIVLVKIKNPFHLVLRVQISMQFKFANLFLTYANYTNSGLKKPLSHFTLNLMCEF